MTQMVHDTTVNKMCEEAECFKQNTCIIFVYNLSVDSVILYTGS